MIKTLQTIEKRDREPYRVPRSVQNAIPIMRLWENGIFQIGKEKYSKQLLQQLQRQGHNAKELPYRTFFC